MKTEFLPELSIPADGAILSLHSEEGAVLPGPSWLISKHFHRALGYDWFRESCGNTSMGSDRPNYKGYQEDSREVRLQYLWNVAGHLDEAEADEFQCLVTALLHECREGFAREYLALSGKDCSPDELTEEFLPKLFGIRKRLATPLTRGRLLSLYRGYLWDLWLDHLWTRRSKLSEREWEDFWYLTRCVLKPRYRDFSRYYSVLCQSDTVPEQFIDDFFLEKIVMPALSKSGSAGYLHAGSLALYYERFLIGLVRRVANRTQNVPLDEEQVGQDEGDDESVQGLQIGSPETPESVLSKLGLAEERVRESALSFLRQNEPWVTLFLGMSVCASKGSAIPVYKLAASHGIPSQANKARKLGISVAHPRKCKDAASAKAPLPFARDSMLSRWIQSLGVECIPDNREAMLVMLKILCEEALSEAKELKP